jgi:hypothetical protein
VIVLVSVGEEKLEGQLGSIFLDCKEAYYYVRREVLCSNIYEFFIPTKLATLIKMCSCKMYKFT